MSTNYKTEYSENKNINTLDRGSYNDWGDGTPARQSLVRQNPGDVFDVNILSSVGDTIYLRDEAICPVGSETLLVSYAVPTGESFSLKRVLVGGDNIAKYLVKINGDIVGTKRTWWTRFDDDLPFDNLKVNGDDILSVYAINRGATVETLEATILGDLF